MKHNRIKSRQGRLAAYNEPGALRRRTAARLARIAAEPEPVLSRWAPGQQWYTITISCPDGSVTITADVPRDNGRRRARSECWAVAVDGDPRGVLGATAIGRIVAHEVRPRTPVSVLAGLQTMWTARDEADAAAA